LKRLNSFMIYVSSTKAVQFGFQSNILTGTLLEM